MFRMGFTSYKYFLDIDGTGTWTDITQYVYRATWRYGRDYSSQLTGRSTAGSCSLYVRNRTSYFSKYNPASPFHDKTLPGIGMRVQMSVNGGAYQTMWQGDLQTITPDPGDHINGATAVLSGAGVLSRLAECLVTMPMHEGITTGDAIADVLDTANFPAGDRALDTGRSTLSRWWTAEKVSAFQAIRDLEENECGFVRESKDGKLVFEDRGHRAGHSVVANWSDVDGSGVVRYGSIFMEDCVRDIYNIIEAKIHTFNISEEGVIWTYVDLEGNKGGDPLMLEIGETKKITASFSPSGSNIAVNEWGMIDYLAYANADGSGDELTEHVDIATPDKTGATVDLEITNNSGRKAYVTLLRAHGTTVVESDAATVKATTTAKIDRTYPFPGKFLTNDKEAQDFCDHLLALYKDPRPIVTMTVKAHRSLENALEVQAREVSDKISVYADEKVGLFIDGDFYVESVQHEVDAVAGTHLLTVQCSEDSLHDWPDSSYPYVPKVIPPDTPTGPGSPHVPDDLWVNAISNGLQLTMGATADKWNDDVDQAEFRAQLFDEGFADSSVDLRTVAEGGALAHNGTDQWVVTGLGANFNGATYVITAAQQGRLYFAFRLHNTKGWSVWTDGNDVPSKVIDFIDTETADNADSGPPADWSVAVVQGIAAKTVRVRASRPKTNSHKIWFCFFQIKDASTGQWRGLSEDSGVVGSSKVLYDGSAQAHTFDPATGEISIDAGGPADFGNGAAGGIVLVDKRGSAFDDQYCDWVAIAADRVSGNKITGCWSLNPAYAMVGGKFLDLRIMIVKPFWEWTAEGYQGLQAGLGSYGGQYWMRGGDKSTQTFESIDMPYDPALDITKIQGRCWFRNGYSFSDDDTVSPNAEAPPPAGNDPGVIILTYSSTITIDCNLGSIFYVKLTGDATLAPLKNAKNFRPVILVVQQDSAGGHHLFLDAKYNTGIDIDDLVTPMDSDERDYYGFMYDAEFDLIDIVAFVRGY
jgi:hypothetical protein